MATVDTTLVPKTAFPPAASAEQNLSSRLVPKLSKRKMSLGSATRPQSSPKPPLSPDSRSRDIPSAFTNWQTYSMNNRVNANYVQEPTTPSPPSTMTTSSPRSSMTSYSTDITTQTQDHDPYPYSNGRKPRSASFAVPTPTSCCPNCGLRRPSSVAAHTISPSRALSMSGSPYPRPHLPLHLHCPDFCPDDHFPAKEAASPTSPFPARRHHRRRSSLYYAESLIEDAHDIDGGSVPVDVKQSWEKQAQSIARKIVMRKAGLADFTNVEEAVED